MFGTLGGPELILILVIALIVFGPRKLPEIGKSMGKMMYEFRKASTEFQRTINDEIEADKAREAAKAPPPAETPAAQLPAAPVVTAAVIPVASEVVAPAPAAPKVEPPQGEIVSRDPAAKPIEPS